MEYALIDYGSNTIRVNVYRVDEKDLTRFSIIWSKKTMAGMVGYLDKKSNLSQEGIDLSCQVLSNYANRLKDFKHLKGTFVFATAVLRRAKNRDEVMRQIKERSGLDVQLLDGKQEARCGFWGAMCSLDMSKGIQIDLGGSSTEIVRFKNREIQTALSLPLGSLSCFLSRVWRLLPSPKETADMQEDFDDALSEYPEVKKYSSKCLAVVGGSGRALKKLRDGWLGEPKSDSNRISIKELQELLDRIHYDPQGSMLSILQICPDRVHTVAVGLSLILQIMTCFDAKEIRIAKYGVREGYLLKCVLNQEVPAEPVKGLGEPR